MTASILAVEIRDELYAIIREPTAAFFSIAMPVGMFAVFATLFGTEGNGPVSGATLMLATFGAFGVISVALTPGIGIAEDRERGWLQVKRVSPSRCAPRWRPRSPPAFRSRSVSTPR